MARSHFRSLWFPIVLLLACGSQFSAEPVARPTTAMTVAHSTTYDSASRTRTEVSVIRDGTPPKNPTCVRYCERLTACRDEIGYIDPVMSPKDLLARCEADENQCYRSTTEAECCGALTDCQSFARCQAQGGDAPSACQPGRETKKRTLARLVCEPGAAC